MVGDNCIIKCKQCGRKLLWPNWRYYPWDLMETEYV